MFRLYAQSILPEQVEEAIFNASPQRLDYVQKVRNIVEWSRTLNIVPTVEHLSWDQDMWMSGTKIGALWESVRSNARPKEAKEITFNEPTLLQCPRCNENKVHISKMVQKRGCDEPATIYACCKNPKCKESFGREFRFRTEG